MRRVGSAQAPQARLGDRPQARELLDLAVEVAREAGELLLLGRAGTVQAEATKSSPTDVVTALDRASEELVGRRLLTARPGDGVLGEEGADETGTTGVRWVVDPLDGTVNFLYNIPNWAVSIGAEMDGEVVAGVVHAPALGMTYTAVRGAGAARNGVPLHGSRVAALDAALVGTGFGYTVSRRAAQVAVLTRVITRVRDIRRMGSASLDLCAAAAGTLDAYYERGLQPWDHAAGGLVAREAGLLVGGLGGRPPSEDLVVAAPPALFGPLTALLAQHPPADRD
jgi:myo-inositol-1(or 4)-monophosphatase